MSIMYTLYVQSIYGLYILDISISSVFLIPLSPGASERRTVTLPSCGLEGSAGPSPLLSRSPLESPPGNGCQSRICCESSSYNVIIVFSSSFSLGIVNIFQPHKATFSGAHTLRTTSSWAAGTSRLVVDPCWWDQRSLKLWGFPRKRGIIHLLSITSMFLIFNHPRYEALILISYQTNLHQSKRYRMITVWLLLTSQRIVEHFLYPYIPCTERTIRMFILISIL